VHIWISQPTIGSALILHFPSTLDLYIEDSQVGLPVHIDKLTNVQIIQPTDTYQTCINNYCGILYAAGESGQAAWVLPLLTPATQAGKQKEIFIPFGENIVQVTASEPTNVGNEEGGNHGTGIIPDPQSPNCNPSSQDATPSQRERRLNRSCYNCVKRAPDKPSYAILEQCARDGKIPKGLQLTLKINAVDETKALNTNIKKNNHGKRQKRSNKRIKNQCIIWI